MTDTTTDRGIRSQLRTLVALAVAQFGDYGESQISNSMFPAIRSALGVQVDALGLILAVKRGVQIVGTPFWGFLSDRFSRKAVLVWGTGVWGIWTVITGFSQNFTQLLILTLIAGFGIAALEGPLSSLLSDLFPTKERGRAFGVVRGLAYVGMILSLVYYSILAKRFPVQGWRIAYWTFGGISVLSGLLIYIFIREPVRGQSEEALSNLAEDALRKLEQRYRFTVQKAIRLLRIPTFSLSMIDTFVLGFPFVILVAFSVTWLVDDRGFTNAGAILYTLFGLIGLIAGSAVGGWMGDRSARRMTERGRLIVGHAAQVLFAADLFLLFSVRWNAAAIYALLLWLAGFLLEFRVTGMLKVVISSVLLPEVRSSGFAVERVADSLGRVLGSLIVGKLAVAYGLTASIIWLGAWMAVLGVVLYVPYYVLYLRDASALQATLRERVQRKEVIG